MGEQNKTNGTLALGATPRVITILPNDPVQTRKLRVAAYARVSTNSEDQLHSYAAQNAHYTELITENPEWEFVDVYADQGITGTSADKRDEFQRMLKDCRQGRIDKILTKTSSRFARNAKESLEAVRELKALGIGVYFEEQNIDTAKASSELLIAIFAMLAQKESESISSNLRWGIDKRMQSGKYNTCYAPFGYYIVKGKLILDQEKVPVIQYIYNAYLSGKTAWDIADELNTFSEEKCWKPQRVDYILTNERYCGNALLRKRYKTNSLPRKTLRNRGQQPMYYAEGINEAAIPCEIFEKARELRERRKEKAKTNTTEQKPLAGQVFCGNCGRLFRSKKTNNKWYMVCRGHEESPSNCSVRPVSEKVILSSLLHLYYKLQHQGRAALTQLLADLQTAKNGKLLWSLDVVELNKKIADITNQERLLAELKQQGLVDPDIFISRSNALAEQLRTAKREKERLIESEEDQSIQQTQALLDTLETGPEFLETFDGELFSELVEKIIVESSERLRFRLINGLELTEPIERTVR